MTNVSLIEWNEVVPFAPRLGSTNNVSSYLQWTIPLAGIKVSLPMRCTWKTSPNDKIVGQQCYADAAAYVP